MKKTQFRLAATRQPFILGSSETTREAPIESKAFCFNDYLFHYQPEHIQSTPIHFLEWFVGFSEAGASFIISKQQCSFVINQKDVKILYKIKTILGFGRVYKYSQKNEQLGRYLVGDKQNCERLVAIFNGNFVLEKTKARFQFWAKMLNQNSIFSKKTGQLQLKNAWLSGFIDAEGCFYAKIRKSPKNRFGLKIEKKFSLNQKGEKRFFSDLKKLLKSNAQIQEIKKKTSTYFKLEVCSMKSNQILLNYLITFPCQGQKKIASLRYRRILGYIERKEHLNQIGFKRIQRLCKNKKNDILF